MEKFHETKPFLVVCPTTVLSHWQDKLAKFAPALNPQIYHGQARELDHDFKPGDIILTSYGIIRNDIDSLEKIDFSIAVFDEIQYLKNKITNSYRAAKKIKFSKGFGLSGTPIENRLSELKSLMDIVLPGYLGSDRNFNKCFIKPIEDENCKVFLGSLKAGGTGIDLVAASVVTHYDRWRNAAKEDQATDRVHRIGQTRGVQVFKFVTKDTLEVKIAAIIDRKRKLMNSIVKEDSADSLRTFTKAELYDLLSDSLG